MPNDRVDEGSDKGKDARKPASDSPLARDRSDRSELSRRDREEMERLKAGASSGVSGDFGRPILDGFEAVGRAVSEAIKDTSKASRKPGQAHTERESQSDTTSDKPTTSPRVGKSGLELILDGLRSARDVLSGQTVEAGEAEQSSQKPRPSARRGSWSSILPDVILDGINKVSGSWRLGPARPAADERTESAHPESIDPAPQANPAESATTSDFLLRPVTTGGGFRAIRPEDLSAAGKPFAAAGADTSPAAIDDQWFGLPEANLTDAGSVMEKEVDGWFSDVSSEVGNIYRSVAEGPSVETNAHRQVTRVTSALGEVHEFKRDAKGQITEMTAPDATWVSSDAMHWKNEKGEELTGTIEVDPGGTIRRPGARAQLLEARIDGTQIHTAVDGSRKIEQPNGMTLSVDSHQNITRIESANGMYAEADYAPSGTTTHVKDDRAVWTSTDGENWKDDQGHSWTGQMWFDEFGNFHRKDAQGETAIRRDGVHVVQDIDGSVRTANRGGQLTEIVDANGRHQTFKYDAGGQMVEMLDPNGLVWESKDGLNFTTEFNGKTLKCSVVASSDGTRLIGDDQGNSQMLWPDGRTQVFRQSGRAFEFTPDGQRHETEESHLESAVAEKVADLLHEATSEFGGPDMDVVYGLLKGRSAQECQSINDQFKQKYHECLEDSFGRYLKGDELERAKIVLQGTGGGIAERAIRVHAALSQVNSDMDLDKPKRSMLEKDLRDTIATMKSPDLEQLDREYQHRYGQSLQAALQDGNALTDATKETLAVYLQGDALKPDERVRKLLQIADSCFDGQDIRQEALSEASEEIRREHLGAGYSTVASEVSGNTGVIDDNESAIVHAITSMSDEDREKYKQVENLIKDVIAGNVSDHIDDLNNEKLLDALQYFANTEAALRNAGDATEVAQWEATIRFKDQQVVSRIASHDKVSDDDVGDVSSEIVNMNKADWDMAKSDPVFRQLIIDTAKAFLDDDEMKQFKTVLDNKLRADTYEQSKLPGQGSVIEAIDQSNLLHPTNVLFGGHNKAVVEAILNMTPKEREQYRNDPEFREKLDKKVQSGLSDLPQEHGAVRLFLEDIAGGRNNPSSELRLKLFSYPAQDDILARAASADEYKRASVIHDLQAALNTDHGLAQRITSPQTSQDKDLAQAIQKVLKEGDFNEYAKPLLETGRLPIEKQVQIDREFECRTSALDTDHRLQQTFKDIENATPEERQRLQKDTDFQKQVLGSLTDNERQVATFVIEQERMRPEDEVRARLIGMGVDKEGILALLSQMSPDEKLDLRDAYLKKYGEDLSERLLTEVSGQEGRKIVETLVPPNSRWEIFDQTRGSAYGSRGDTASAAVGAAWDATGRQVDNRVNDMRAALVRGDASLETMQALRDNTTEAIQDHKESKEAFADAVVDGVIGGVGVAGAAFTGGLSLGLLVKVGVAGGAFKVAVKAGMLGDNYDSSNFMKDFVTGGVGAALNLVGPGELQAVLKIGNRAAASAAEHAVAALAEHELAAGGRALLKKELEKEMVGLIRESFNTGNKKIGDEAFQALADKVISQELTGEARTHAIEQLASSIKQDLAKEIDVQSRAWLKRLVIETAAGAAGGGVAGGVGGAFEWDSAGSTYENVVMVLKSAGMSAVSGAGGAVAFTTVIKVGGVAYHGLAGGDSTLPGLHARSDAAPVTAATHGADAAPGTNVTLGADAAPAASTARSADAAPPASTTHSAESAPADRTVTGGDRALESTRIAPESTPVRVVSNSDATRQVVIGEQEHFLIRLAGQEWFYGGDITRVADSPVKVHVMTNSPEDLGQLQKVLIPKLMEDEELKGLVKCFKTFDPNIGVGKFGARDFIPNGRGNGAKGFTIYTDSAEDALRIQKRIDQLLSEGGLPLARPIDTGNIDPVRGQSNRVSVVREYWEPTHTASGQAGAKIDDELVAHIQQEFPPENGGQLSPAQLRQVERATGIRSGTLSYDEHDHLMLVGQAPGSKERSQGYYADEANASKRPGDMTDRPALYALAQHYHLDQAELAAAGAHLEGPGETAGIQALSDVSPLSRTAADGGSAGPRVGDNVTYEGAQYYVVGFDRQSGEPILYQEGRGQSRAGGWFQHRAHEVTEAELVTAYREIRVGNDILYRDQGGSMYRLHQEEGRNVLWTTYEFRVARTPDAGGPSSIDVTPSQHVDIGTSDTIPPPSPRGDVGPLDTAPMPVQSTDVPSGEAQLATTRGEVRGRQVELVQHQIGDSTPTELYEQGGWWYPRPDGPKPPLDRGIKLHVFAPNPGEFAKLQDVLIPALQNDPELARLVPEWKTLDPRFRNPDLARAAGRSTDGAVFTIGVKDPLDAVRVQRRIDEILAQHPELKLATPPRALNVFSGETNRVGIVRDFWPVGNLGTEARLDPAKVEEYRNTLGRQPGERFTPEDLQAIEINTGAKLRYDETGNLMVREFGARVDPAVVREINGSFGLPTGQRLSVDQLHQIETRSGLKEGTLAYDSQGHLVLKGTPGESRQQGDNYFLQILKSERNPRGQEYTVRDARTGEVRTFTSDGLTDQPAMYRLSRDYGVEPVDAYRDARYRAGLQSQVGHSDSNVAPRGPQAQEAHLSHDGIADDAPGTRVGRTDSDAPMAGATVDSHRGGERSNIEAPRPMPYTPDVPQSALQDGRLEADLGPRKGGEVAVGLRDLIIRTDDGVLHQVIFHPDNPDSVVRVRKEMAAYRINNMLELGNGFPLTVRRTVDIEGVATEGWVQTNGGEKFSDALRKLSQERYGEVSINSVSRLVREDPELRQAVETAFVERMLLGDRDMHSGNMVMAKGPDGRWTVQNIDLDFGFEAGPIPRMDLRDKLGVNRRLFTDLSEQRINPSLLSKVKQFVERYENPAGRIELAATGLSFGEVEDLLSRARNLADSGRFPRARTPEEQVAGQGPHAAPAAVQAETSDLPTTPPRRRGPIGNSPDNAATGQAPVQGDLAEPATPPRRGRRTMDQMVGDGAAPPTAGSAEIEEPRTAAGYHLEMGNSTIAVSRGEITLGRDPASVNVPVDGPGVSRRHASIRVTEDGAYIRDLGSTNGTYVNGQRVSGEIELRPGDRVRLGGEGQPELRFGGKALEAAEPRQLREYHPSPGGGDRAADPVSIAQSNKYLAGQEISDKLPDGFQVAGGSTYIDESGLFHNPGRVSTVIDRTQDVALRNAISEAHRLFDHLKGNPEQLAQKLLEYSRELMTPGGWTDYLADAAFNAFVERNGGKRILLGEFIEQAAHGEGAGLCQQQSLLFKVLSDDFGLKTTVVRGIHHSGAPEVGTPVNHAWTEVTINGQRLIYDPRLRMAGLDPKSEWVGQVWHSGRDLPWLVAAPQEVASPAISLAARAGDQVNYQGHRWRVEGYNPDNGDVVLVNGGIRRLSTEEVAELNPGRPLRIGEQYNVRRTSGNIEGGWTLNGVASDGTLVLSKNDASRVEVSREDLARSNPGLLRTDAQRAPLADDLEGRTETGPLEEGYHSHETHGRDMSATSLGSAAEATPADASRTAARDALSDAAPAGDTTRSAGDEPSVSPPEVPRQLLDVRFRSGRLSTEFQNREDQLYVRGVPGWQVQGVDASGNIIVAHEGEFSISRRAFNSLYQGQELALGAELKVPGTKHRWTVESIDNHEVILRLKDFPPAELVMSPENLLLSQLGSLAGGPDSCAACVSAYLINTRDRATLPQRLADLQIVTPQSIQHEYGRLGLGGRAMNAIETRKYIAKMSGLGMGRELRGVELEQLPPGTYLGQTGYSQLDGHGSLAHVFVVQVERRGEPIVVDPYRGTVSPIEEYRGSSFWSVEPANKSR